jgi:CheY-like chemotaxis protein
MVVEDDPTFINVLILLLEDEGYDVDAAKRGVEALSKIMEKD